MISTSQGTAMNTLYRIVGQTIILRSYRGDGLYRVIRVASIRDTHDELIKLKTMQDNIITRGRYLVVGTDLYRGIVRSYYLDHTDFSEVGLLGRAWHAMMVWCGRREQAD